MFGVKYMKKRFLACLLSVIVAFSLAVPAVASAGDEPASSPEAQAASAEQTQIVWRTVNGQLQYRVWSITWGYWLTDWINYP